MDEMTFFNNIFQFFFELSHIFDFTTTQQEVYQKLAMPLLTHALSGINVCLFAYGQTGSGKTYRFD